MIPQGLNMISSMLGSSTPQSSGQNVISGSKGVFSTLLASMVNHSGMSRLPGSPVLSTGDVANSDKTNLLGLVKKFVLSKWGSMENLVLDKEGLEDFEKFLIGAGFDSESVKSLMENLKAKTMGKELKLPDLFNSLENLQINEEKLDDADLLEISVLPYIETILSTLGLDDSKISDVLNDSKIEGSGISLSALVRNLKSVKSTTMTQEGTFELKTNVSDSRENNNYLINMMSRIGIKDVPSKESPVTLDDFISGLESLLGKQENVSEIAGVLNNDLKSFLSKVSIKNEPNTVVQEFAFKNKYLNQKGNVISNGNSQPFAKEEGLSEQEVMSELSDTSRSGLSEKSAQQLLNSKMDTSGMSTQSNKSSGNTSLSGKHDNSLSFTGFVKDTNVSDNYLTASEAKPPVKSLPMYVVDQVGRQIIRSINNGENEIRLQIKPPTLGRLQMTIDNTSDGIKISILAEHRTTKDLILSHTNELKSIIQEQGIQINKIDVQVSSDFQQAMQDMRQRESKSKERGKDNGDDPQKGNDREISGILSSEDIRYFENGKLDLVA